MRPPLVRLPDGTVNQVSPITGTVVWTVPGRAHRPVAAPAGPAEPVAPGEERALCAFCEDRRLETPPEKERLVAGTGEVLRHVSAAEIAATTAEFRRIPNLFEIISVGYWRANHGWRVPAAVRERAISYAAEPEGRAHLLAIARRRAPEMTDADWAALPEAERLARADDLFAGSHDVVVARRHLVDGATRTDQLAASGTLTVDEHRRYVDFTVRAAGALYREQPHARYVSVFQNWLRPAGASFDHLHKQLVAIDEYGPQLEREIARMADDPDLFDREVLAYAEHEGLVIARNEGAVAVAGVGHRYPAVEVYATGPRVVPWESPDVGAVADLLHAMHAATGAGVATNEEWHYRPPGVGVAMPWRVVLKWRVSNPAGFEGGTKIYVNTIDPWTMRARLVARLYALRDEGAIAPVEIGDEITPLGRPSMFL